MVEFFNVVGKNTYRAECCRWYRAFWNPKVVTKNTTTTTNLEQKIIYDGETANSPA